jgi:DNA-binding MarR family transcriptional regulator
MNAREDAALTAIERAMVRIRRSQTRRTFGRLAEQAGQGPLDLALVGVVDAVEEGGAPVTVGMVAERLGIDPSRASRLVAQAVQAGYVARVASQEDGRRVGLELTSAGDELARAVHRFRQARFDHAMREWSPEDREAFARLLTRFTDELG